MSDAIFDAFGADQRLTFDADELGGAGILGRFFGFVRVVVARCRGEVLEQVQFQRRTDCGAEIRLFAAGAELRGFVIGNPAQLRRHQPLEDRVNGVQQDRAAAKVVGQVDRDTATVGLTGGGKEVRPAIEEQARLGEAEAIDALLHIADGEHVCRARGSGLSTDETKNLRLDRIDVLKLIDQDVLELVAQARRNAIGLVRQQRERAALQIGEIEDAEFRFGRLISGTEIDRELKKQRDIRHGPCDTLTPVLDGEPAEGLLESGFEEVLLDLPHELRGVDKGLLIRVRQIFELLGLARRRRELEFGNEPKADVIHSRHIGARSKTRLPGLQRGGVFSETIRRRGR